MEVCVEEGGESREEGRVAAKTLRVGEGLRWELDISLSRDQLVVEEKYYLGLSTDA